jgi:hypothetical protein
MIACLSGLRDITTSVNNANFYYQQDKCLLISDVKRSVTPKFLNNF